MEMWLETCKIATGKQQKCCKSQVGKECECYAENVDEA